MRTLVLALIAALAVPGHALGSTATISLASVAAQSGYAMRWLGPERTVSLSRPGTVIVIRPGESLYDVNSHVEIADAPPIATPGGDVLISARLAGRLRALARRSSHAASPSLNASAEAAGGTAQGSIVLRARQLDDEQSLAVAGQAPPNAPITITLLATLAPEVPTVILSRHDVQSDVYGRFSAVIPVASDYWPGTLVTVLATSVPDVTSASAYVRLGAPNAGVPVPVERTPRGAR